MTRDTVADGPALADRLATAIDADEWLRGEVDVVREPGAEPDPDGSLAWSVERAGESLAEGYVQPDRARVEFGAAPDAAASAGREAGLRVRPKAARPPRTLVFVESPADVERVLDLFEAVVAALD